MMTRIILKVPTPLENEADENEVYEEIPTPEQTVDEDSDETW